MTNVVENQERSSRGWWRIIPLAMIGLASAVAAQADGAAGPRYVSMGSSFAAGPGVTVSADTPANRCSRSADNYAHQLARKRRYLLVDVACSGATTAHVLGPWDELAPQIEALTPDTALVTLTIGGNDVSFVRDLIALACGTGPAPVGAPGGKCPTVAQPTEADWSALATALDRIGRQVRQRAPHARLVFVQYLQMTPARNGCPAVPIDRKGLAMLRMIQDRLTTETKRAARKWRASLVDAHEAGTSHDPCSKKPWVTGFPTPNGPSFVPFHPNRDGMTAIANRLHRILP